MIELFGVHQILRWVHIVFGFAGLVVFWAPVLTKKGGRTHKRLGKIFVLCAYVVGFSALLSSLWALAHPASFVSLPPQVSAERAAAISGEVRFFFGILTLLSVVVLGAVESGIPVVRTRREPEGLDTARLRTVYLVQAIVSGALLVGGVMHLARGGASPYWIWVGLGVLVLADARGAWRHMKNPLPTPMAWWYRHMESMLGAGIAFHTALVVFGAQRLFGFQPEGVSALLPWVLPSAIGVPAISIWIRHYRRKFGEAGGTEPPIVSARA